MNNRAVMVVLLFSCVLAISGNAHAQSIVTPSVVVISHTNIQNGELLPRCETAMQDSLTIQNYLQADAFCTLNETPLNSPTAAIETWNCFDRFDANCNGTAVNAVEPGATYGTDGDHALVLVADAGCIDCYFDPLGYIVPDALVPTFPDSGTVTAGRGSGLPVTPEIANDPNFRIARTAETPFVSILVSPPSVDAKALDVITFTADRSAQWTLTGAGTIDPSTPLTGDHVLYHAPASIAIDSVDQLTACDLSQLHGQNCTTVRISLHPLIVNITGPIELFPSQESFFQPDYVASVSAFGIPVNTAVDWSESDTSLANLVTPSFAPTTARLHIASTSQVVTPFDITLQACAQLDRSRCGNIQVHVPVSQVFLGQPTGADFVLDANGQPIFDATGILTFDAGVSGPVLPEDAIPRWGIVDLSLPGEGPNLGSIITDPTNNFQGLYTPPTPPIPDRLDVKIKACIGGAQSQFDPSVFADEICAFYTLQLQTHNTILSSFLTANSGETNSLSVLGFGFGSAPTMTFADPNVKFIVSSITGPDSTGRTTISGTVTTPPLATTELTTLTVTSSLPPPSTSATTTFRVNAVRLTPTVAPTSATLLITQSQQFIPSLGCATVGGQPCTVPQTFTCSVTPVIGVMNASTCLYTAPSSLATATTVSGQACSAFGNKCVSLPINLVPVSVTVAPATASLDSAQSQQFQSTVTNVPNNNQSTSWSIGPAVGSISAAGLYTAPAVVASLQTVSVNACSSVDTSRCASATVTLNPVTVAITPSTPVTLAEGQTQQFQATITHSPNPGVVWSISPAVGSISNTGLYTAPPTITANQTVVVKVCSSIALSNCASSNVNLIPPDFALSVSPTALDTGLGFQEVGTVSITPLAGFAGTVTLSATVPPNGMSASFSPATITGSGSSGVHFPVTAATPGGTYAVTITGTSGGLVHSAQVTVTVLIESITVTASAPQTAAPGTTVTFTFNVTNNGFIAAGDGINVTGIPPGSTVIPTATTGGIGAVTVEFTTATTLAPGTYPITYTASSGSLTGSATTSLTIPAPPPPPPPPPRCTTRDCLNQ